MNEEEVKQWMKEHIAKLSVGAIWAPENSGLVFKKTTEQMLTLERMWDFPETHQVLDNITKTLTDLAYTIDTSSVKVVPLPKTQEEYAQQTHLLKKELAISWADADGMRFVDMDLDNVYPTYDGLKEVLLDNGDTAEVEMWSYKMVNPETGTVTDMDPDDYHLLTDDEHFMRFAIPYPDEPDSIQIYKSLNRGQVVDVIDGTEGNASIIVLGKEYMQGAGGPHRIPPWMWGSICVQSKHQAVNHEEE